MPEPGERKLELLALLANGPRGYTELREKLKITDPALQRHLKDLQAQGIVGKAEDGKWILKLENAEPNLESVLSLRMENVEGGKTSLYEPSDRLKCFAYQDLNPLISPGALGIAKFAAATLLTFDVYPIVKMARHMTARIKVGKQGGDEYQYAIWLQHLIADSVSFDAGFMATVRERGVTAQRDQLGSIWTMAEGFVDNDLGFNYERAYESNRRLIEGKRFKDRMLKEWTFEGELREAGFGGRLTEDQFLKLWGWVRVKVYVLGEWKARKLWKELLSAGIRGCRLLS
jgi:DNA-binding transcriptional ArsR family regulator